MKGIIQQVHIASGVKVIGKGIIGNNNISGVIELQVHVTKGEQVFAFVDHVVKHKQ